MSERAHAPACETATRRGFLKATGAAALFPYLIAGSVKAQDGKPAPSNRITLATIGYGNQSPGDVGSLMGRGEVQYLACCDVRANKREELRARLAGKYGQGIAAYNDFREIIARDDIDAVHIATPDHWHAIISCWAMKSGKDVYCQKPFSLTIEEAWIMHETSQRYGRVFQTGSQQRSSPEFLRACSYVRSGRIGTVKQVNVNVGGPSMDRLYPAQPIPAGFDWNMWLGPAPYMPYNEERSSGNYGGGWRQVRDYSGGMMTDWGAHHFDICQWGVGMDGSGPDRIVSPADSDEGKLTYYYSKTPVGDNVKVVHQGPANGVRFIGTKGEVEVNRGMIRSTPDGILRDPLGADDVHLYDSHNDHFGNFIDCIKSRELTICPTLVGAGSITMCHLGNIAHWTGRSFGWDPVKRELLGDDELKRWTYRPMRAPWHL